jgi:hypothetical protein
MLGYAFCPTPGSLVEFVGKALTATGMVTPFVFKNRTYSPSRDDTRNCRVRQPGERNVVKNIIPGKSFGFSFKYA